MSTTTKNCEECAHHRAVLGNELACALDQNYGWKRKCDDFRPTGHNVEHNRRTAASSPGVRVDGPVGPREEE